MRKNLRFEHIYKPTKDWNKSEEMSPFIKYVLLFVKIISTEPCLREIITLSTYQNYTLNINTGMASQNK